MALIMFSSTPLVGVDHALPTVVARTEPPKFSPISAMSIQSGPLVVGDHVALTTAVANCFFI